MRDYAKTRPEFWTRGTGKRLRGHVEAQLVAHYLITGPQSHMTGLFYCPMPILLHETGLTHEGASKALARLSEEGFAYFDEGSDLFWVPTMAREQVGSELNAKDNNVRGIQKHISRFRGHRFYNEFLSIYGKPFHLKLKPESEAPSEPLPSPFEAREQRTESREQEQRTGTRAREADQNPTFADLNSSLSGCSLSDAMATSLAANGLKRWDAMGHLHDLHWIAMQPMCDIEKALANVLRDDWAKANLARVTPAHLRKHWPRYLDPPAPEKRSSGGASPVSSTFDESQNPEWAQ